MNKVIIIYGPTAVGKSAVSVQLAKMIDGEIISADSMQIYRHLDVGSAKITYEEMEGIIHHLIDIKEPYESYSVSDFVQDANKLIEEILNRGKTPIICGGTGLYVKALISGYDFGGLKADASLREDLQICSFDELLKKASRIGIDVSADNGNKRRIIRKIELATAEKSATSSGFVYPYELFCLYDDREKIYDRINKRVDKMFDSGLLDEASYLFGLNIPDCQSLKAIGYKELKPYFDGTSSLNECKEILKQKSRNYAKRQITFMNQFENFTKIKFTSIQDTALQIYNKIEEK